MASKYVYPYTLESAMRSGKAELEACRESYLENIACSHAIEKAIADNFDGMRLSANTADAVIADYGFDRVQWVLANTLQHKSEDGRFSHENKAWASNFYIPSDTVMGIDRRRDFIVNSHPAVLDGFLNQTLRAYEALHLWTPGHCNAPSDLDFQGRIMVLSPKVLKDEYKKPEYQLIHCDGGFGCDPNAIGRRVYGSFLYDGTRCEHQRLDFLGELKSEHLPDWAKQKLSELEQSAVPVMGGMKMQ